MGAGAGNESPVRGKPGGAGSAAVIVPRKYSEAATPWLEASHAIWLSAEGRGAFFPVDAANDRERLLAASAMGADLRQNGWNAFASRYSREVCCAVFWIERPVAVTYTTLFTGDPRAHRPVRAQEGARKLYIIEQDPELRRLVNFWFSRQPGCVVSASAETPEEALADPALAGADVIFFDRFLADQSLVDLRKRLGAVAPSAHIFTFGMLAESDDLFRVLSGVEQGYFFRRRPPDQLFEPIAGAWGAVAPSSNALSGHLHGYFRSMFELDRRPAAAPGAERITYREEQILNGLRQGFSDKEIAQALSISPQTVHTHLKHIFEKLGAHSRTEAVMKFLQK
jgi:DNA-binding NarL/FixJ family response regulator